MVKIKQAAALSLAALLIAGSFADASGNRQPASFERNSSEVLLDKTNADPTFDAHEALGEDIWRQLESASKEAVVAYDGLTGEVTIIEIAGLYSETAEIKPCSPEGIEAAPVPSASARIDFSN